MSLIRTAFAEATALLLLGSSPGAFGQGSPIVISTTASNVTYSSASLLSSVNPNGLETQLSFQFGPSTNYGNNTASLSAGSAPNAVLVGLPVTELLAGTTYQFRAVASNEAGVVFGSNGSFSTLLFSNVFHQANLSDSKIAWADYDNDGNLDFIRTPVSSLPSDNPYTLFYRTVLYHNNGNGTFTVGQSNFVAVLGAAVAWGDFDNDGFEDFIISGRTTSSYTSTPPAGITKIYHNNGNGTFSDLNLRLPDLTDAAVATGDFDNDGRLDFALSGRHDQSIVCALFRNNGDGTFRQIDAFSVPVFGGVLKWADWDRDGKLDLFASGRTSLSDTNQWDTFIYQNFQSTFFSSGVGNLIQLSRVSADFGDFNNDGYLDLLMTGSTSTGSVTRVYRNTGNGFSDSGLSFPGCSGGLAAWGDFDNDGRVDIVLNGQFSQPGPGTRLFRNTSTGTFRPFNDELSSDLASPPADANGDGSLDFMFSRLIHIAQNLAPSRDPLHAPVNLVAQALTNGTVRLKWQTDETSSAFGRTYAVRVGTIPGGIDIVAPDSDPVSGRRRLPQPGPISSNSWTLSSVPHGSYYWSVQVIDGRNAGSAFAVEQSFEVTNGPPVISQIPPVFLLPNTPKSVAFTAWDYETVPDQLLISATVSNTVLLPLTNIVISGSTSNRLITLSPATNQTGIAHVTLTATDSTGLRTKITFPVYVQEFTMLTNLLPNASAAAWGDFDNDGNLDLAITGPGIGGRLYHNNGNGTFTLMPVQLPGNFYGGTAAAVYWIDYDNDGYLDLFFSLDQYTKVFWNGHDGNFYGGDLPYAAGNAIVSADFDGDGKLDVLLYSPYSGNLYPYRFPQIRYPDDAFGLPPLPGFSGVTGLVAPDLNNDGRPDLVVAGWGATIYLNIGNGRFTNSASLATNFLYANVAVADFDNDGFADLLVMGWDHSTNCCVIRSIFFRNNGDGTFSDVGTTIPAGVWGSISCGDVDNDGYTDVLLAGATTIGTSYNAPLTTIYHNNGDWTFTDTKPGFLGAFGSAGWCDFDNNGNLDVMVAGTDANDHPSLMLYQNNHGGSNAPPSPPAAINSAVDGKNVLLSWDAGTDPESASGNGMTYNVRVGHSPNAVDTVAPNSDPVSGWRRLPQSGNAGLSRNFVLSGLLPGTYFWSVQTVDAGLRGSAFAREATFAISNSRPVASNQVVVMREDSTIGVTLHAWDSDAQMLIFSLVEPPRHGTASADYYNSFYINYAPVTNYFGEDRFTFVVSDGITDSEPATVTITITNVPDVQSVRLLIAQSKSHELKISLLGEPWELYQIEASEDLQNWSPFYLIQASPSGSLIFTNPPPLPDRRFFRAVPATH